MLATVVVVSVEARGREKGTRDVRGHTHSATLHTGLCLSACVLHRLHACIRSVYMYNSAVLLPCGTTVAQNGADVELPLSAGRSAWCLEVVHGGGKMLSCKFAAERRG